MLTNTLEVDGIDQLKDGKAQQDTGQQGDVGACLRPEAAQSVMILSLLSRKMDTPAIKIARSRSLVLRITFFINSFFSFQLHSSCVGLKSNFIQFAPRPRADLTGKSQQL